MADKIGRRASLAAADLLFTAGSLCMAAAPSVPILVVGRILVGLGIGVASVTVPVYIAEISPSHMRAQAVTANVLAITSASYESLGVFVGYSLSFWTPADRNLPNPRRCCCSHCKAHLNSHVAPLALMNPFANSSESHLLCINDIQLAKSSSTGSQHRIPLYNILQSCLV